MSSEFEVGRKNNPSEEANLTPEEKVQQNILDYVKDEEIESPQFQAFADYTDLQYAILFRTKDSQAMIKETIRQRVNGVKGYKREHEHFTGIVLDFKDRLGRNTMPNLDQDEFYLGLLKIKNREIDRKSQPPLPQDEHGRWH